MQKRHSDVGAHKTACAFTTALLCLSFAPGFGASENTRTYSSREFLDPIKYLSGDKLKGRGDGIDTTACQDLTLLHAILRINSSETGSSRLAIADPICSISRLPWERNCVLITPSSMKVLHDKGNDTARQRELTISQDFLPLSFSESVELHAPLAFAGYGITAPEFHYDDYRGLDVKGKIVIVLRHEPQENDEKSIFAGKQLTTHAEIVNKAINARNHGAVGMILANDRGNHPGDPDELIRFGTLSGPEQMNIAALQVKAALVDEWLKPSGTNLDHLRQAIDRDLSNHSFLLHPSPQAALNIQVERIHKQVANVVGVLPGQGATLARECIVIGAHYDHLGLGDQHSLAPRQIGQIHHGADDNASGTSGVLELANGLAGHRKQLKHSIQ